MIRFGTSGWRSIMAEEFTFANVRRVVGAIGNYLQRQQAATSEPLADKEAIVSHRSPLAARRSLVVVGYDTRFLSPEFAREAAAVLASQGFSVLLSKDFIPTPVVSFQVRH